MSFVHQHASAFLRKRSEVKVATSRSGAQGCGRGQLLTDCQHRPSQLTTKRMEQEVAMILDSTLHGLACLFSGQIDYPADDMAVTQANNNSYSASLVFQFCCIKKRGRRKNHDSTI